MNTNSLSPQMVVSLWVIPAKGTRLKKNHGGVQSRNAQGTGRIANLDCICKSTTNEHHQVVVPVGIPFHRNSNF